jgi:PAT family beta-lactamase induction signal transducer AmpG
LCGYSLAGQVMFISFIAINMSICWEKVAATQFAIYMAWSNLSKSIGAGIYAQLNKLIESSDLPFVLCAICCVGMCLVLAVDMSKHRQRLEKLKAEDPVLSLNAS